LKMYFSYSVSVDENFICPFPSWVNSKICKPLDAEMRPFYFIQALMAMRDYPLVGYGPGTFQLINRKDQQLPYSGTFYTHNSFLQVGAEMGILAGTAFLFLMGSFFWQAGKLAFSERTKIKTFDFNQALFIGSFALLINSFFDFDWSYLGVFSLTIFFLGLILRTKSSVAKKQTNDQLVIFISQLAAVFLVLLTVIYLLMEILTRTGRVKLSFDIFPYFKEHMKVFEAEVDTFSSAQKSKLTRIYQFDSAAYFFNEKSLEKLTDEQLMIRKNLYLIDPWLNLESEDIAWYLEKGDYQAADQNLSKLIELAEAAERRFDYQLGFTKKFELTTQRLDIADYYFGHGKPSRAAEYYLWSRSVEPWIFAHRLPPVSSQTPISDLEKFLLVTEEQDSSEWGENYYNFINWHLRVFRKAIEEGDEEQIKFWFELTDQKFSNLTFLLWRIGSTSFLDSLNNEAEINDQTYRQQKIMLWASLWEAYDQSSLEKTFDEYEKKLSEVLVELSQSMVVDSQLSAEQKDHFQTGMAITPDLVGKLQLATESYLALEQVRLTDIAMKMFAQAQDSQ
ncbi:MAG: O-antigen ligase family protein, partial [Candidatus Paceibacterota bacterium]